MFEKVLQKMQLALMLMNVLNVLIKASSLVFNSQ